MEGEEVSKAPNHRPLSGRVALVAGATRGAGRAIAVELARSGAYVYATGRSSRAAGRSEIDRPETIEETGELIAAVGGEGTALRVDHLEPDQVAGLVGQIEAEQGRLDVLVNDIFGETATPSGTRSCGSTTSPEACACCAWGSTRT
jgi:NAD(P)-dependent dehydrogenase (short-subunit alcohol dehydrogenase family)